jgi:hypothetical protein
VVGLLRDSQRAYRAQTQRIDVRQNLRIAAALLPIELRELDAAGGDLVAMGPSAITIRAQRQLAVLCRPARAGSGPNGITFVVRDAPVSGVRDLRPADSVLVFSDGDASTPDDDGWATGAIGTLATDTCPDGRAGRRIAATLRAAAGRPPGFWGIGTGAPVLGFESLSYRLYRSSEDGRWYVGQQSGGDLQPVLGPVTSDGLSLTYLDSSGATTTDATRVAMIQVRVRARTSGGVLDSVTTLVWLRNNRRRGAGT